MLNRELDEAIQNDLDRNRKLIKPLGKVLIGLVELGVAEEHDTTQIGKLVVGAVGVWFIGTGARDIGKHFWPDVQDTYYSIKGAVNRRRGGPKNRQPMVVNESQRLYGDDIPVLTLEEQAERQRRAFEEQIDRQLPSPEQGHNGDDRS